MDIFRPIKKVIAYHRADMLADMQENLAFLDAHMPEIQRLQRAMNDLEERTKLAKGPAKAELYQEQKALQQRYNKLLAPFLRHSSWNTDSDKLRAIIERYHGA